MLMPSHPHYPAYRCRNSWPRTFRSQRILAPSLPKQRILALSLPKQRTLAPRRRRTLSQRRTLTPRKARAHPRMELGRAGHRVQEWCSLSGPS
jgi:hypothetical protein